MPMPPVGGSPYSSALMKSSSRTTCRLVSDMLKSDMLESARGIPPQPFYLAASRCSSVGLWRCQLVPLQLDLLRTAVSAWTKG